MRAAGIDVTGGVGERTYRVASAADLRPRYELGAGEMVIDLRDVRFPAGRTELNVRMGMGHVMVRIPLSSATLVRASSAATGASFTAVIVKVAWPTSVLKSSTPLVWPLSCTV